MGDANAYDLDGDALAFSIVGGADAARFFINAQTGQLFFINAPDYENPADANGNNLYELTIRVSDGQLFQDRSILVNVEDLLNA
ncbi:MAG: cadherin repeat domain-containing protein [Planctomycetaceae bacterium]